MSWNIIILYTYFRWPLLALGSLGSSSLFQCSSRGTLTRKMIGAFILGLKNGWVKPIAWFGFCLQDFSRLLSWSLYTPKSFTLCGSHVQSQEDVSIVCNRFETKLKTTCLIPIYCCKKKFSFWPCRNFFVDQSCSVKIAGYSLELVHLSCQMPRPQSTLYQFSLIAKSNIAT